MNDQPKILQIKDIVKSYRIGPEKVEVIKGISMDVNTGETLIIMGPSGVGKSTLLHVMGLLDIPDTGEVKIDGQATSSLTEEESARLRNKTIGFVFQFHHLLPEFTALENVMIPMMMYNIQNGNIESRAKEILDIVGLSHRLTHKPRELSGGEQQRVAVARALVNDPKLLLADEPTGNLDRTNGDALFDLLLKLNREMGQTLVIVTHNEMMSEKADLCVELEDGKIRRITRSK